NTVTVEARNYLDPEGSLVSESSTFIGVEPGLLFKDESGNIYTDTDGTVKKEISFTDDSFVAGQDTDKKLISIANQTPNTVQDVHIYSNANFPSNVSIALGKDMNSVKSELLFSDILQPGESRTFYASIVSRPGPGKLNADFQIKGKADIVE
ncbi:MAG: hypothetical protein ACOCRO_07665, partial [Halanaerobiales bacterium]